MPVKRNLKRHGLCLHSDLIDKKVETFAAEAELQQITSSEKEAVPTIGFSLKLNRYEHNLLKSVAKKKGRSMQKQIKIILVKELEKHILR